MSNADAHEKAVTALLAARNPHGYWTGELACSALATATAVSALAVLAQNSNELRTEIPGIIEAGLDWLAANQTAGGGIRFVVSVISAPRHWFGRHLALKLMIVGSQRSVLLKTGCGRRLVHWIRFT